MQVMLDQTREPNSTNEDVPLATKYGYVEAITDLNHDQEQEKAPQSHPSGRDGPRQVREAPPREGTRT